MIWDLSGYILEAEKLNNKAVYKGVNLDKNRISHLKCSIKKVLLKMLQNSQENTCAILLG